MSADAPTSATAAIARLVTYAATCLALIRLRRQRPQADRWRAPAGKLLAVIGIVFCAWLALRMNATHATIMAAVAVIGTANWLVVRSRPPLAPAIKTV